MFTGIVETLGKVEKIEIDGTNINFHILSLFKNQLIIGQSIAHNGVCLTITSFEDYSYVVTAVQETLFKTNLGDLKIGSEVNLERCMEANGRFDGHIVQGHVDCIATCTSITDMSGSWKFVFEYADTKYITVEKGSITVNGVSLTVVDSHPTSFTVVVIPHTYTHTNFKEIRIGTKVNLEFDIVGKYIQKLMQK